ncbi:hypothetical protein D3C73_1445130 [compost metagenome]
MLHERDGAQVAQHVLGAVQFLKLFDGLTDLTDVRRQVFIRAYAQGPFRVSCRVRVIDSLAHRQLVEIVVGG